MKVGIFSCVIFHDQEDWLSISISPKDLAHRPNRNSLCTDKIGHDKITAKNVHSISGNRAFAMANFFNGQGIVRSAICLITKWTQTTDIRFKKGPEFLSPRSGHRVGSS